VEFVTFGGLPVLSLQSGPFRVRPFPDGRAPLRPAQKRIDRLAQRFAAGPVAVPGQDGSLPLTGLCFRVRFCQRLSVDSGSQLVVGALAQVWLDQFARLTMMPPGRRRADHLKSQFRVVDGIHPGKQLVGITVLGILVSGDMRQVGGECAAPPVRERVAIAEPARAITRSSAAIRPGRYL
jgi:hypothetical protein